MTKTAGARKQRAVLATMTMGSIARRHMQDYMDAMRKEGAGPATMKLEQAMWRSLFNHAVRQWDWKSITDNPATGLEMPALHKGRDRILSDEEQDRLDAELVKCKNKLVLPVAVLLRESAMRSSEPLKIARWRDIDWDANILNLQDSKTQAREVPLSPMAIDALKKIATLVPNGPNDPILTISYNALLAAWNRACERAGIENLKMHDLRHTAATRLALMTGNLELVKALTGHKDDKSLKRYVNVKARDVVAVLHGKVPPRANPWGAASAGAMNSIAAAPANAQVVEAAGTVASGQVPQHAQQPATLATPVVTPAVAMETATSAQAVPQNAPNAVLGATSVPGMTPLASEQFQAAVAAATQLVLAQMQMAQVQMAQAQGAQAHIYTYWHTL